MKNLIVHCKKKERKKEKTKTKRVKTSEKDIYLDLFAIFVNVLKLNKKRPPPKKLFVLKAKLSIGKNRLYFINIEKHSCKSKHGSKLAHLLLNPYFDSCSIS